MDVAKDTPTKKAIESSECELGDTEILDATQVMQNSFVPSEFVLFCHGISNEKVAAIKENTKVLDYNVHSKMTEDVTHVIVELDPDRESCSSDKIYYMSILMGKWIVDYKWFKYSLEDQQFINEKEYSAKGSHDCLVDALSKARHNLTQRKPRLFDGFHFYLHGQISNPYPSKAELMALLKSGGGIILKREPDPESISSEGNLMPYHVRYDSPLTQCSHFIIYQEGPKGQ